jgi:alanine racemase
MTMIDVTDIEGASVRDEAVVLGCQDGWQARQSQQRHASIGADEIAAQAGTIAWEILTSISRRVPRFYREP